MSTILVTGASGFVGSHVVPALIDAGHQVVALVRSPEAAEKVQRRLPASARANVTTRLGDVTDRSTLPAALAGVDAVVHLVAIPRDWDGGASLRLVNTEGTRNLVAAARTAGVRRFVHQGALGVTDDPALQYASSKARAERLVAESDLDWTILKPSLIWGERDGFFNVIASLVRMSPGLVPIPAGARSRFQPLFVGDLARIAVRAIDDPSGAGRTWELGGPDLVTYREIVGEVLRGMGARRAILPLPQPLIRFVARTSEALHLPFPVASDQLRQLQLDNMTAPDVVEREFGFAPRPMAGNLGYLRRTLRDQEPPGAA